MEETNIPQDAWATLVEINQKLAKASSTQQRSTRKIRNVVIQLKREVRRLLDQMEGDKSLPNRVLILESSTKTNSEEIAQMRQSVRYLSIILAVAVVGAILSFILKK